MQLFSTLPCSFRHSLALRNVAQYHPSKSASQGAASQNSGCMLCSTTSPARTIRSLRYACMAMYSSRLKKLRSCASPMSLCKHTVVKKSPGVRTSRLMVVLRVWQLPCRFASASHSGARSSPALRHTNSHEGCVRASSECDRPFASSIWLALQSHDVDADQGGERARLFHRLDVVRQTCDCSSWPAQYFTLWLGFLSCFTEYGALIPLSDHVAW